jgi:hypothetical protein
VHCQAAFGYEESTLVNSGAVVGNPQAAFVHGHTSSADVESATVECTAAGVHSQTTCPDDGATADGYAAVERCVAAAVDDERRPGLRQQLKKGTFEAPEKAKCMGLLGGVR